MNRRSFFKLSALIGIRPTETPDGLYGTKTPKVRWLVELDWDKPRPGAKHFWSRDELYQRCEEEGWRVVSTHTEASEIPTAVIEADFLTAPAAKAFFDQMLRDLHAGGDQSMARYGAVIEVHDYYP